MLIAYDSKTGNVRRFINKLKLPAVQIEEHMTIDEPYVLVTYTTGFGQIPEKVSMFLERNHSDSRASPPAATKTGASYTRTAQI